MCKIFMFCKVAQIITFHTACLNVCHVYLVHVVGDFSKPLFHLLQVFPLFLILKCHEKKERKSL